MHNVLTKAGFLFRYDEPSRKRSSRNCAACTNLTCRRSRTFLYMDLPPWILAKEVTDNWRTSAWGRITGFTTQTHQALDDHVD